MLVTKQAVIADAFATMEPKKILRPFQYELGPLGENDIELTITHCGICHSDLHLINNDWRTSSFPLVPGHEIIGVIKAKGTAVNYLSIGQRVGIGWQRSSCLQCEFCLMGDENLCAKSEATCVGHFGGFSDKIRTDGRFAFPIPTSMPSEIAAPLLCGGATVFSPFLDHKILSTSRIGVIGIGGLGHLALQFAHAFGCEVTAFSSSPEKEEEARAFGADHFVLISQKKALEKAKNTIDFLLATSSYEIDWQTFIPILRPKGTLCLLGIPEKSTIHLSIPSLVTMKKKVSGSPIGGRACIQEMLHFSAEHHILPKVELFPMTDVNIALEKLAHNKIRYRGVLFN